MQTRRILLIAACTALLAGCAHTSAVVGQFSGTKDEFMGEASAAMWGEGTLHIQTQAGVTCEGTLVRPRSLESGNGKMHCSDGRTGTFVFTKSNTYGGTGFGSMSDGERFRFNWGNDVRRANSQCEKSGSTVSCTQY
ncbi:hypothetical protein [Castellaniella sp.]|uniref:hypothetical protein n=1 Tax=Castellaniella sp. TaxID=1955812 RepID=UPI003A8CAADE